MSIDPVWLDDEPQPLDLSLGRFSFQLRGDSVSDVAYDGRPLLRALRFIVRDENWGTLPATVTGVEHTDESVTLIVQNRAVGDDGGRVLDEWTATLTATDDSLRFAASGVATAPFLRNRFGIIVLHPPTVAGLALTERHPDGTSTEKVFPAAIAPHQPSHDIAGLDWSIGGVRASLDVEGDVFEMEDQRNWTDASFKTYSPPLGLPFPVRVAPGDTVEQAVTLRALLTDDAPDAAAPAESPLPAALPSFAFGASTAPSTGPFARPAWLRGSAVLVELDTGAPNWRAALDRAAAEAGDDALDVRVVVARPTELDPVLDALAALPVVRLGVFSVASHVSEPDLWAALVSGAAERGIGAQLVGGARSHFTELNRTHGRIPRDFPSFTFSTTPQMHELARAQVVEALGLQRLVAEQAVEIAGGAPVHIGPVTLRARYNAVSTAPRPLPTSPDLSGGYGAELVTDATDPRSRSHGFAAWLIASAASLAVPGVASIAFAETLGARGLAELDGTRLPASFAAEWLVGVAGWQYAGRASVLGSVSGAAIAARQGADVTVLFGNPHAVPVTVSVTVPSDAAGGSLERLRVGEDRPAASGDGVVIDGGVATIVLEPGEIARWSTV